MTEASAPSPVSHLPPLSSPRIALVAGEASGDLLGAELIGALRERYPHAEFAGVAGPQMIASGCAAWFPAEKLSVMGLTEVLRHLPELLALRRELLRRLLEWKPDVFVGIDAPDFNLGLERKLKSRGLRTVHYVSPSVWAWREKRAAKIGRSADRVLCLFPMEPAIYARHCVSAHFVGHPLADRFPLQPDRDAARSALGLPADAQVLALLPGSRLGEIARLAADFIAATTLLRRELPHLRVIAPMANAACRCAFEAVLARHASTASIEILDGRAHEAMLAADAVLLASGTAALEALLAKRPMVVAYRVSAFTAWLIRTFKLMRVQRFSLPNALADGDLVPELMQEQVTPAALAAAVLPLLRDPGAGQVQREAFERIHRELRRDASRNAAAVVGELIESASAG